jgi:hypothetical protein
MTMMQEYLKRAAAELGLTIKLGYDVKLPDGITIVSEALFPELGNPKGTLVFCSSVQLDSKIRRDLMAEGYGISTFSEPLSGEIYDVTNYADMFLEWGWSGDASQKPQWME